MDRCEECGFVYDEVPISDIGARLSAFGALFRSMVSASSDEESLHRRPDETTWSPLEYVCHVRDVFRVQHERLNLALETDVPAFTPMDRDERPIRDRYNDQDPAVVLDELDEAARRLGSAFAALTRKQLDRTGIYNYPMRAERTMTWVGRHTIHEGVHHVLDIERQIRQGS